MSKPSRRPNRSNRSARRGAAATGANSDPVLEIVIGTTPQRRPDGGIALDADVAMVKSALLYADRVELISPAAAMVNAMTTSATLGLDGMIEVLEALDPVTRASIGPPFPADFRNQVAESIRLSKLSNAELGRHFGGKLTREQRDALRERVAGMKAMVGQYRAAATAQMTSSTADQLGPAIEAGLVVVSDAGVGTATDSVSASVTAAAKGTGGSATDALTQTFVTLLMQRLADPRKHLLLDDLASGIVDGLVRTGAVDLAKPASGRAAKAAVGVGLIARLPGFDTLAIPDILELRVELDEHLSGYRRAVAKFSAQVAAEPFTDEVPAEIDALMRDEVRPALVDLQLGMAQNGRVREVTRALAADPKAFVAGLIGTSITIGVAASTDLHAWLVATSLAASGTAVGTPFFRSAVARSDGLAQVARHDLYYLHQLERGQ